MDAKITPFDAGRVAGTAEIIRTTAALQSAFNRLDKATAALRAKVVEVRPLGLLTVDEMAEAIGRDRNYVDSIWSSHGVTTKGKQTRVRVTEAVDGRVARGAYNSLKSLADRLRDAASAVDAARRERDHVIAEVYRTKSLGPSAIASVAGIDRNHVLRIARKAGVRPVHRSSSKNQYTVKPKQEEDRQPPAGEQSE